jgi:hypothetical protein
MAEVNEGVELWLYFPSGISWPVTWRISALYVIAFPRVREIESPKTR